MNANDESMRSDLNALRTDMNANDNALRSESRADFRALDSRVDALSAEVVAQRIESAQIKGKVDNIETIVGNVAAGQERLNERMDEIAKDKVE